MRALRIVRDALLIFLVGGVLYVCVVGSALYRNVRNELRKKQQPRTRG